MERTKDLEDAGFSKSPDQTMVLGLGEGGVMGGAYGCVSEMGHTLALTSLFPTEIGLEDLGTERTCIPIPRVKFGEAERP